ncbi:hypothetical protein [Actinomadura hibisca]|uniref:hypothetical protein n=1 Tax=Actinomadura hibisca TaxID=68565 RepID=UPI000831454D|nr:hypothetical protein [Actinomadura hibisca]
MSETTSSAIDAPAWFMTTPKAMADVVMHCYRTWLCTYGLSSTKVGLINSYAASLAAPTLVELPEQPANEALRAALTIIADAYAEAMETFWVFPWAIDQIQERASAEIEEVIEEHVQLRDKAAAGDDGAHPPAQDGAAREAVGEDPPGG